MAGHRREHSCRGEYKTVEESAGLLRRVEGCRGEYTYKTVEVSAGLLRRVQGCRGECRAIEESAGL